MIDKSKMSKKEKIIYILQNGSSSQIKTLLKNNKYKIEAYKELKILLKNFSKEQIHEYFSTREELANFLQMRNVQKLISDIFNVSLVKQLEHEDIEYMMKILTRLNTRDEQMILKKYGLNLDFPIAMNFAELSRYFNISSQRANAKIKDILLYLKKLHYIRYFNKFISNKRKASNSSYIKKDFEALTDEVRKLKEVRITIRVFPSKIVKKLNKNFIKNLYDLTQCTKYYLKSINIDDDGIAVIEKKLKEYGFSLKTIGEKELKNLKSIKIDDLGFRTRLRNVLHLNKIHNLEDLLNFSQSELKRKYGITDFLLNIILKKLKELGLSLKEEEKVVLNDESSDAERKLKNITISINILPIEVIKKLKRNSIDNLYKLSQCTEDFLKAINIDEVGIETIKKKLKEYGISLKTIGEKELKNLKSIKIEDLGFSTRLKNTLLLNKIHNLEDLLNFSQSELKRKYGITDFSLNIILKKLKELGLSLKEEEKVVFKDNLTDQERKLKSIIVSRNMLPIKVAIKLNRNSINNLYKLSQCTEDFLKAINIDDVGIEAIKKKLKEYGVSLKRIDERELKNLKSIKIEDLGFNTQLTLKLKRYGINTLDDLVQQTETHLLEHMRMNKNHYDTITKKLNELGLSLKKEIKKINLHKLDKISIKDLGFSEIICDALLKINVNTLYDLTQCSEEELLRIDNIGEDSINQIVQLLNNYGLSLNSSGLNL